MSEDLDRDLARQYLTCLRTLLQQHYRHLTNGQPHHHGPLVERVAESDLGFEALIVLLPPYSPTYASFLLDLIEACADDAFDAVCEPGPTQVVDLHL